jgi:hypothetical protein
LSLLTLPSGIVSFFSIFFLFSVLISNFVNFFLEKVLKIQSVGLGEAFNLSQFDWFYFNIKGISLVLMICLIMVIFAILTGRKIVENRFRPSLYIIFYMATYSIMTPVWFLKAMYNVIVSEKPSWR